MSYEAFREQCAQICDEYTYLYDSNWSDTCAERIRALSVPKVKDNNEALRRENEALKQAIKSVLPALIELDGKDSGTEVFTITFSDEIEMLKAALKGGVV